MDSRLTFRRADAVLVLLLLAVSAIVFLPVRGRIGISVGDVTRDADLLAAALMVLMIAPLVVRRQWPAAALAVTTTGFVASELIGYPPSAASLAVPTAAFALGQHSRTRTRVLGSTWAGLLMLPLLIPPGTLYVLAVALSVVALPILIARLTLHSGGPSSSAVAVLYEGVAAPAIPAPVDRPGLPGVSAREHDVLALVALGRSNAEIATTLSLSRETVKSHVSSLLRKTGRRDRTQLAVLVLTTPGTDTAPNRPASGAAGPTRGRPGRPPRRPGPLAR